jgi:hypothetical protein
LLNDPLQEAARAAAGVFAPERRVREVVRYGSGHIHDTFVARSEGAGAVSRCVVQRINATVFPDPEALARNLDAVTRHLANALRARGVADAERRHLRVLLAPDGRALHRDAEGRWWRAFPFLEDTRSYDVPQSPGQAREAARAFGGFVADLADLAPGSLVETIPAFHDLRKRLAALDAAASRDAAGRLGEVAGERTAATGAAERILAGADPDALPRRVVHNDCKLNNLLFDAASDEALCVVDLDTVMAGSALFDFGELVRTAACPAAEDERDLARVRFDLALFGPLAEGFVAGARGALGADEVRALADAGPRMALENAVRFLTDHLDGDRYFRVARPGHNLDRARAQLRLVSCMMEAEDAMRGAVDALAREAR